MVSILASGPSCFGFDSQQFQNFQRSIREARAAVVHGGELKYMSEGKKISKFVSLINSAG